MVVFLAIVAFILLAGMIGEKEQKNRDNLTMAFMTVIAAIVVVYMVGGA